MQTAAPSRWTYAFKRHRNLLVIWAVLIACVLAATLLIDVFLNPRNILNISRQAAALSLVAMGQTFVLVIGGIDLSVGSTISLVVVVMAAFMAPTVGSMVLWSLLGIAIGLAVGAFNAVCVTRLRLNPLMVTLATLSIVQGLALVLRRQPQATLPREFSAPFVGELFGVPVPLLIMLAATVAGALVLSYTRFGRHLYALGSNEHAAGLSGLRVDRLKFLAYSVSGLMAGCAGVYMAARSRAGDPLIGEAFTFDSITAVILGGASLYGGRGSMWGTLAGVLIIAVLSNALNLLGVPGSYQFLLKGGLLVAAVMLYR